MTDGSYGVMLAPDVLDLSRNQLLGRLSARVLGLLRPALEPIRLAPGQVIYEPDQLPASIVFPTQAIVSLLYTMKNGTTAQMGIVGRDGVVGLAVFMGGDTAPNRAAVLIPGDALRMEPAAFRTEARRIPELQRALLLYSQALLTQMSQTAVCNQFHSLEQQLCRLLLLSHDRADADDLLLTQELLANTLGVRRGGVSVAAHRLQDAGLIRYRRGRIAIIDRVGLEREVCECYAVVSRESARLLDC